MTKGLFFNYPEMHTLEPRHDSWILFVLPNAANSGSSLSAAGFRPREDHCGEQGEGYQARGR